MKFKLKITGFELEVEGTRENAEQVTAHVGETLRGLINPPTLGDHSNTKGHGTSVHTEDSEATVISSTPKRRGPKRQRQINQNGQIQATAIDFIHAPEKYGTPTSKWKTADKAIWLLYILKDIKNVESLSTPDIVETFNRHFKSAKTITTSNVTRDLGKKKIAPHMYVGEDTRPNSPLWYLTDEGIKYAQKLISEQKAQTNGFN